MLNQIAVSVIIPVYNAESHIKNCLNVIINQNFKEPIEIIIVDDASTDNSSAIIGEYNLPNLKLYKLEKNLGQSAARNKGLEKAKGEYIYFMDVDDFIHPDSLEILYSFAKKDNCDFVFSDFKRIVNNKNQRTDTYNYETDKIFYRDDLLKNMQKEIHNPSLGHLGLFGCNGRLIRNSIIKENNIRFIEELRYFEDKTFGWDLFGNIKNAQYIRKQLYSYYVYPNVSSAGSKSIGLGFKIDYFK
jgi:glycosyltransferase involved in cell wall biosynthesis